MIAGIIAETIAATIAETVARCICNLKIVLIIQITADTNWCVAAASDDLSQSCLRSPASDPTVSCCIPYIIMMYTLSHKKGAIY